MNGVLQDVRYALRQLRKSPGFTATAVLTLAFGIAATTVLYSILDGAYIHFAPTEQGNRNTLIVQKFAKQGSETSRFSAAEYFDLNSFRGPFEGFLAVRHSGAALTNASGHGTNPEQIPLVLATANIFSLNGISPIIGRVFTQDEDRPGGPNVAVLTYRLWANRFACNPSIVGKVIRLDGVPYDVIGITPRRFQTWGADIYLPLRLDPASTDRSARDLTVSGVRKPGVSADQTTSFLQEVAHREETQFAATNPEYAGLVYEPLDIRAVVMSDLRLAIYLLMGAVFLLLLISTTNIANLLVARSLARAREIATRLAIGATTGRLTRQFLTESTLVAVLSASAGVLLGIAVLRPVLALIPAHYIGEETEIHISWPALAVSFSIAIVLGVLFGMAPALFVSRRGILRNLGQSRTGVAGDHRSGRYRLTLLLPQIALAFVVLTGAGLMLRTYRQITSMDLGFNPDHVLTMRVAMPTTLYPDSATVSNFSRQLIERGRSLPGVVDIAISSKRPMEGWRADALEFSVPGRPLNTVRGVATSDSRVVTPSYFTVVRNPLREGRSFTDQDTANAPAVAIVNESFARKYLPDGAVGKQVQLNLSVDEAARSLVQVVGVVADSRQFAWDVRDVLFEPSPPEIFLPLLQHANFSRDLAVLVRNQGDAMVTTEAVRRQILSLNPNQPVYDVETLRAMTDESLGPAHLCLVLLGALGAAALVSACIGLYAIVSYGVAQRRQEIGVRIALGARRREIVRLIVVEGMRVVFAGLAVGLVLSLGMARFISSLLYRVPAHDTLTVASVSTVLIAVAALASYIPARRAAKVDPMVALRYE